MRHRRTNHRPKGNKASAQRYHAGKRAAQRVGATTEDLDRWLADIQASPPRARFLLRQSHRVTLWAVRHATGEVPVVYDKERKVIVSVLPPATLALYESPPPGGGPT